ncbi:transcriptional initiation protein Tat [Halegenticoccus soli]|uniref:transcriptional initiation protein Tat n=1 Tax=Halegenticoccus soli TaxID=1985678 RepID=UPI000C6CF1E3|nr:transcriptional initiation protein Tat [Halegenticoccus soli]
MRTNRRAFLGALCLGLSAGCLEGYPGATGPRNPPDAPAGDPRDLPEREPLYVSDFSFEETGDGDLRAVVAVANRTDDDLTAAVVARVAVGDEEHEKRAEVNVPGGGKTEVAFDFPVAYEAFERDGSFRPSASVA